MNVQKNVCFTSKLRYLNVQKSPGHTVQQPIVGGGTVAIQHPAEFIRFKEHRCLTNSQEVIDFLRNKITESPELGLREIKIKTEQEKYEDEMAKLQEQIKRVNEAKGKLPLTQDEKEVKQEEIVESAKTVVNKPFVCWLGKCRAPSATLQGLQKHLNDFHKRHMKKENIVKKLNELAKEDGSRNSYRKIKGLVEEEKNGGVQAPQ